MSIPLMPYVRIVEQPARGGTRFRYECEGRSAGSIPGVNSNSDNVTYPTIQVVNYQGSALVVVSCVTKDYPYRQHPHNLVGERCSNGICKMIIDNKDMIASFPGIGIQCAKRNDIRVRLKKRQTLRIDPFECGFEHMQCSSFEINLSAVRLCFQAFVEDPKTGQYTIALQPVVSDVIFDKKSCTELTIHDVSSTTITPSGGKLMLFTSFVQRDDIEVRFYQLDSDDTITWQELGSCVFVHRHTGISLLTPKYHKEIKEPIQVYLQLRRPSDNETSAAIKLQLISKSDNHQEEDASSLPKEDARSSSSRIKVIAKNYHNLTPKKRHYNSFIHHNSSSKDSSYPILNAAIRRNDQLPVPVQYQHRVDKKTGTEIIKMPPIKVQKIEYNHGNGHQVKDDTIIIKRIDNNTMHSSAVRAVKSYNTSIAINCPSVSSADFACQVNTLAEDELMALEKQSDGDSDDT